ncbi:PyrE Orotate phosphoribosyltransferase [uncultured Caudovirales phage]|uniref:PyrE Orotate phosphoribosyltransferase n=1 Tax=uncultured Caudovirales phage TaxID=2100421 RepID=A0A6J7WTQ2_9CAUD|nr:PyrE Orotate phosphoribosyltransferase [uncultured Caudovirales phage]
MNITEQEHNQMYDSLRDYINEVCIIRRPTGNKDFVLKSTVAGQNYEWQFYMRRGLMNPMFLRYVSLLFWEKYAEQWHKEKFQIAGLETGSTPLIVGLALHAHLFDVDISAFSIRKDRKKYGMLNRFEGLVELNTPVMLVDDLCNSKNTLQIAKKYCEEEGHTLYHTAFTVVNKNILPTDSSSYDKYIGSELKVDSLFHHDDFELMYEDYIKAKNVTDNMLTY